jgi:hypothetical protein
VLEAGGIWPVFTDALEDHAAAVVLAHPLKTRAIASAGTACLRPTVQRVLTLSCEERLSRSPLTCFMAARMRSLSSTMTH